MGDKIREEFEKWAKSNNLPLQRIPEKPERYAHLDTHWAWMGRKSRDKEIEEYKTIYNETLAQLFKSQLKRKSQKAEIKKLQEILKNLYENKSELDKLYILLNRPEVKDAIKDVE